MELVAGTTLARLTESQPLEQRLAVDIGRQIACAVQVAHEQGILHRDLKTENVMLLPSVQVKVLDFGLARILQEDASRHPLGPGARHAAGDGAGDRDAPAERRPGRRLSLGVLLYEILSGVSPFLDKSPAQTYWRICSARQQPLSSLDTQLPAAPVAAGRPYAREKIPPTGRLRCGWWRPSWRRPAPGSRRWPSRPPAEVPIEDATTCAESRPLPARPSAAAPVAAARAAAAALSGAAAGLPSGALRRPGGRARGDRAPPLPAGADPRALRAVGHRQKLAAARRPGAAAACRRPAGRPAAPPVRAGPRRAGARRAARRRAGGGRPRPRQAFADAARRGRAAGRPACLCCWSTSWRTCCGRPPRPPGRGSAFCWRPACAAGRAPPAPACRWLLAYRQDQHGEVKSWLRDVLAEAPARLASTTGGLPAALDRPDRFHHFVLLPLATPRAGADPAAEAARMFREVICRPLELKGPDGSPRYPYAFTPGGAERLARARSPPAGWRGPRIRSPPSCRWCWRTCSSGPAATS